MPTGKKPASAAGRQLGTRRSTRAEKRVAASDLAQAPRKPKKRGAARSAGRKSGR